MNKPSFTIALLLLLLVTYACDTSPRITHQDLGLTRGICVVLGDASGEYALNLLDRTEFLVYLQLESDEETAIVRQKADQAGYLGKRIWIERGGGSRVSLADNIADRLVDLGEEPSGITEEEVLRVLCPQGRALLDGKEIVKPFPDGIDDWSHPYHGPDNNPQSLDEVARAPYLTQFLAEPYYAPLTQVGVASAGRVFKAFGNIAFHVREEALLNSLVAFNGYNGTMLWKRRLTPGVMIHRNTMVATPEILYVGDDKSCKLIETSTGTLVDEIVPPLDVAGGTFWKWMAIENGVLYALIGEQEQKDPVVRQRRTAHGWPWDPLSKGFNQPENPWGFGRNLLAINLETNKVIWSYREEEPIDSRGLCMSGKRIFTYSHGAFLGCLNSESGEIIWRKSAETDPGLFESLGEYLNRQDWRTNWRTTAFLKSSEKALYFAGPSIKKLLAVSVEDGSILWEHPYSNFQLVLREDGLYAISGEIDEHQSIKFDPLSGEVLLELETHRRGCTRPTGSTDAIFYRALGGSVRLDLSSESAQWISPMRAQCHDGVTVANGQLYWWPSTCDCQNSLYGITCLAPAGDFDFYKKATEKDRLESGAVAPAQIEETFASEVDWPTFRADNSGSATTEASIPRSVNRLWWHSPDSSYIPTPPITVENLVYLGGSDGVVRALSSESGDLRWRAYTGGSILHPPTFWNGRLFVGSADGWLYAFEASTGKLLWRFNAAPENRKIPVYGKLMSTWPIASGSIVDAGTVYFAAGIVNYDGTYVYALDAKDGSILWQNNTSGHLNRENRTGVSVQGQLLLSEGKLYLAGGTSVSPAVYDAATGECLNDPKALRLVGSSSVRGRELYRIGDSVVAGGKPLYAHPEFPVYDPTVLNRLFHTSAEGKDIVWINGRNVLCYDRLSKADLNRSVPDPIQEPAFMIRDLPRLEIQQKPLWTLDIEDGVAFARCKNAVLIAGNPPNANSSLLAFDSSNGERLWVMSLPAMPVAWGIAIDRSGRSVVALKDGQVVCYGTGVDTGRSL